MATSAIGPVFTYLLANLPGVLTAADPTVTVVDGYVADVGDRMFVVGRMAPEQADAGTGNDAHIILGAGRVNESFVIPCCIDVWVGGSDQAEARNAALGIWNAFIAWLNADLALGANLTSGYAEVTAVEIEQTRDDEGEHGRRCVIKFSLSCTSSYVP